MTRSGRYTGWVTAWSLSRTRPPAERQCQAQPVGHKVIEINCSSISYLNSRAVWLLRQTGADTRALSTRSGHFAPQQSLWERVHPRTPARPVPSTAAPASRVNPLPQSTRRAYETSYLLASVLGREQLVVGDRFRPIAAIYRERITTCRPIQPRQLRSRHLHGSINEKDLRR